MSKLSHVKSAKLYMALVIISTSVVTISLFACFVNLIIGLISASVFFALDVLFIFLLDRHQKAIKLRTDLSCNPNDSQTAAIRKTSAYIKNFNALNQTYAKIEGDCCELGFVKFQKAGITFSAQGKYAAVKDFNDKKGCHLALQIYGTKLVSVPDGYEDVLDYESVLFKINIGYFGDCALSQPENENGIILDDIDDLENRAVLFESDAGYVCDIDTVETDEIEFGRIEFAEWNGKNKIINFKCIVGSGVSDVVFGKVKLSEDTEE